MQIQVKNYPRMKESVRCVIVGSGPSGCTAAIYASRFNLAPILYEGSLPGGQLTQTSEVENFPGYPDGISGMKMMEDLKKQVKKFGTHIRDGIVTNCDLSVIPYRIIIDNKQIIETETLIICTGSSARYLGLETEKKYIGKGVSTCAVCDGFFYRNKVVAVVGGGDSACEESLYLAGLASKVYLIVRRNALRASQIMQNRVLNNSKIQIFFSTNIIELYGEEYLKGIRLLRDKGESFEKKIKIKIDGLFVAIGHIPNSEIFKEYVTIDTSGYIRTAVGCVKTNLPGVFAAGDVIDSTYRQAIIAAGTGCMAAIEAKRYLYKI